MILAKVISKNGIAVRLTDERWQHITLSHQEINAADFLDIIKVVENPDIILKGDTGEVLAIKKEARKQVWIVVAYKEVSLEDGFIITAYITTDSRWLFQREIIWDKTS